MTVTATSFKAKFPEFASVDDATIQSWLDESFIMLNEPCWGEKYDMGINYYTAHFLYSSIPASLDGEAEMNTGAISARSVDGTNLSYGSATPASQEDSFMSTTFYGQRYLQLRATLGIQAYSI